jgi:hypothetical protein
MTIHDRSRTHPVTAHAFTLPIVREVPICATLGRRSGTEPPQPAACAVDSHAW